MKKDGILGLGILSGERKPILGDSREQERCHKTVPEEITIHMVTVEIVSQSEDEEKRKVIATKDALRRIVGEREISGLKLYWDGKEL